MQTENKPAADIYSFVKAQIAGFKNPIQLPGGWSWSMREHIDTSYLYLHSQLVSGKDEWKPVKNIVRPIINVEKRTEDIELKDVQIYVDSPDLYHLSLLVKKYHDDVFAVENDLDTFFDELNASRIEYGLALSKKLRGKACPENVPLHAIAFCDQTDLLSGPIGIEHNYSPDQLMGMASVGWGSEEHGADVRIEELIVYAKESKQEEANDTISTTPGRYIKVYEVHGTFPAEWLDASDHSGRYTQQFHVIAMCGKGTEGQEHNYTLFKSEAPKDLFKVIKRDPVYGRACGFGGVEELFESQAWTNYDVIRKQKMLDAAAVTILKTTDPNVAARNRVKDMDNLDIIELQEGTDISQVDTFPRNMALLDKSLQDWEQHAQTMGSAEALLDGTPKTNTPFKLHDSVIREDKGLHEWRRKQFARHIEKEYQDRILPHIAQKITEGTTFLAELTLEEMQFVTDSIVTKMANRKVIDMLLAGKVPTQAEIDLFKELKREEFKKKGNKHFIKILKDEFKDVQFKVKVSVAGKSKDLGSRVDSLVNVFRQIIANPAVLRIPAIARIFNDILEYSGLDPADFSGITQEQLAGATPGNMPGAEQNMLTQPELQEQPQLA